VNALLWYESKATGVIQASTSFWPGYSERIEVHGSKGTATITGDSLTGWNVQDDERANEADPAPLAKNAASGASDPMAISVLSFERQFQDFGEAIRTRREPAVNGEAGYRALESVLAIYQSCRQNERVLVKSLEFGTGRV
jgi:predicted dehydrogenase